MFISKIYVIEAIWRQHGKLKSKKLAFGSVIRHMKTVHEEKIGKVWSCKECGKICQTEKRLLIHENKHKANQISNQQYHCEECPYRTIVKEYLVNHIRLMHKTDETGMFMCTLGKCATKPKSFPNQERLQKHKTTHVDVSCDECDKRFSAKRNLRRHVKKKHEDDTLSDMVNRAEVVIQNWELQNLILLTKFNLVDEI